MARAALFQFLMRVRALPVDLVTGGPALAGSFIRAGQAKDRRQATREITNGPWRLVVGSAVSKRIGMQ
ncbi:hypothetical protein [Spirillospora sp. NPDC048819]|uniref:hypothetical protein n=1 Tax=Spirillospora sp. NPDC048819 TaxID=3155268 RepID=UPI0033FA8FBD